jgi:hypothetical protein
MLNTFGMSEALEGRISDVAVDVRSPDRMDPAQSLMTQFARNSVWFVGSTRGAADRGPANRATTFEAVS